ncbi:MAG: hypothetical protein MJ201_05070 [Mycoplasmoidaceae bacterium]|nr:hypothetical protein [Mycoplasmoidaceae bacterium]
MAYVSINASVRTTNSRLIIMQIMTLGMLVFLSIIHVVIQATKPPAIIVQDQLQNDKAVDFITLLKASHQNKFITLKAEKLETKSFSVVPNHIGLQISI